MRGRWFSDEDINVGWKFNIIHARNNKQWSLSFSYISNAKFLILNFNEIWNQLTRFKSRSHFVFVAVAVNIKTKIQTRQHPRVTQQYLCIRTLSICIVKIQTRHSEITGWRRNLSCLGQVEWTIPDAFAAVLYTV